MTVNEILTRLKSLGDDARRAHNTKAGAPDNQFGVKLGDIRAMAKKIKTDHELALNLWDTGNVETQLLATLIIKPMSLSAVELDKLTRSTTCAQVADWLNAYVVAQHPEKEALREKWMMEKDRWTARAGWNLTASRVNKGADDLDVPALLDRIEKEMPKAMPEVQWTMNNTLGAIGIHDPKLRKRAIAIGGDHSLNPPLLSYPPDPSATRERGIAVGGGACEGCLPPIPAQNAPSVARWRGKWHSTAYVKDLAAKFPVP